MGQAPAPSPSEFDFSCLQYAIEANPGYRRCWFHRFAVTRHLIEATAHKVLVVDKLTYAGNLDSLNSIEKDPRYNFVRADILDTPLSARLSGPIEPDVIMHLAAESHVDRSIDGPGEFIQTNVVGTYSLLQCALAFWNTLPGSKKDAFRFHHISTDEVFGSLGSEGFSRRTRPTIRARPILRRKRRRTISCRAWHHTFGLPTLVSNCSNNYGPYHFPEKLIPLILLNALEGKPLPVYGDGSNVRDWLYVEDHARALVRIAEKGEVGQSYNVGGHNEKTNIEVVMMLCAILDDIAPDTRIGPREKLITFVKDRPGHDRRYAIDATKIRRELGWTPRETFESGLTKTVHWYLQNRVWWERIRSGAYGGERLGNRV